MRGLLVLLQVFSVTSVKLHQLFAVKSDPQDDDILFFNDNDGQEKNAIADESRRWPNHTIPYEISEMEESDIDILMSILQSLEQVTCIRFRQKTDDDENYVKFDAIDGRCASYVGMMKKITTGQIVALGHRCMTKGTIQHELLHLLGFWHEHQRADRDTYVTVNEDNIRPSKLRHFQIRASDDSMIVGSYDYSSLLHYDAFAFTKNGNPTVERVDGSMDLGNRMGMTDLDIEKINILYECEKNPARRPSKCEQLQDCKDDFEEECEKQAKAGWCTKMPGEMLTHCKKSCCNCNGTLCIDTSNKYFYANYCEHFFDKENNRYIYAPETCSHPSSAETTRNYCPKLCNMCQSNET